MEEKRTCWGLLRRRSCLVPTWRGWLALVFGLMLLLTIALRGAYPFLAVNRPEPGGVLVIEGWCPDSVLDAAVAEYHRHPYERVYITGGPVEQGALLSAYGNYAEMCRASLLAMGLGHNVVEAVPTPPVKQDRTYASAVALRQWWRARGMAPKQVNLFTVGPHARRSRLLFRRALGRPVRVGVVAIQPWDYDVRRWWRSSPGFRSVTGEIIAYTYVRVFFWRFRQA